MDRSVWSKTTNHEKSIEKERKKKITSFLYSWEELLFFFFFFRINTSRGRTNLNTLILPVYMCLAFVEFVNDSLLMSRICQA
jgi:cellulose synthase/poly-beta-1,6-N-acetylglucosamine synthase-like glycosyltransferase